VQRVEAGMAGTIPLDRLRRIFTVVEARGRFSLWWNGAAADRILDERHARLVERAVVLLERRRWIVAVETSFSEYGERGSIDILAAHPSERAAAVVEVKSEFGSLEETNRVLDVKARLGAKVAERLWGWTPTSIGRLLVLPDETRCRRVVEVHQRTMGAVYPARGRQVRAWLRAPSGPLSGIWFLSEARHRSSVSGPVR
jgi:hypothetical protein